MTTFPNSHRLQKGVLIGLDASNPLASIVMFQDNPETLWRTLRARTTLAGRGGGQAAPGEAMRLARPPEGWFMLEATHQLVKERARNKCTSAFPS